MARIPNCDVGENFLEKSFPPPSFNFVEGVFFVEVFWGILFTKKGFQSYFWFQISLRHSTTSSSVVLGLLVRL